MLVALVLLLAVLGKRTKRLAAVIGGLGFGLFIDELGKFITADNDYFFQPTIALIYVIFVLLFLSFRAIELRSLSVFERLVNAADLLREVILGGARHAEIARALLLLDRSGARGPLADGLRGALMGAECEPERPPSALDRMAAQTWHLYDQLLAWPPFQRVVLGIFVVQATIGLAATLALGLGVELSPPLTGGRLTLSIESLHGASLASSLLSVACGALGVVSMRHSRLNAFRWFERSVVVSIFFTQIILFWEDQLAALVGLVWNLVLLATLRYLTRQEEGRRALAFRRPADYASGTDPVYSRT